MLTKSFVFFDVRSETPTGQIVRVGTEMVQMLTHQGLKTISRDSLKFAIIVPPGTEWWNRIKSQLVTRSSNTHLLTTDGNGKDGTKANHRGPSL